MMVIHDFTYTGGDSGAPYQVQQYDRLDRAVAQAQYYFDSVRDWRQDAVNYATQARQDRDHIQTLGDTIASTGQHIDTRVQDAIDAADTATTAASHTSIERQAAQTARTAAETAEHHAGIHATDAASSASSAADILVATEALGITVDTSVGTRVFVGDTMIYGDTGWRDVRDHLINGWSASEFMVRRINSIVYVQAGALSNQAATDTFALVMPPGFRTGNANNTVVGLLQFSSIFSSTVIWGVRGGSGGRNLNIEIGNDSPSIGGQLNFNTPNNWPTSLPGTPA